MRHRFAVRPGRVLQPLPSQLRNSIHNTVRSAFGNNEWYDKITLQTKEREAVDEAKKTIFRAFGFVSPGRVIAELTFGFWLRLLAPNDPGAHFSNALFLELMADCPLTGAEIIG